MVSRYETGITISRGVEAMRTWLLKLEAMAAAVAFAEQGEWKMAQGIMDEADREQAQRQHIGGQRKDQRSRKQGSYRV
jgi:hypothetical protein